MKVYKTAKVWAIICYLFAFVAIPLFSFLLLIPFIPELKNEFKNDGYWGIALISIIMLALTAVIIINMITNKFVIDKNRVYFTNAFLNRELFFHEIKGYRKTEKFILIESKSKLKKQIKITTYFGKTNEIIEWLNQNKYPNLEAVEALEEKKEILNNLEFGISQKEREQKLTLAFKIAKIMNLAGVAIGLWTLLFPKPYQYSLLASVLFPVVYIFILKYFNGLIRIDERKKTTYPSISVGLFTPIVAIIIRSFIDFNIVDYNKVWLPFMIIFVISLMVFLFRNPQTNAEKNIGFSNIFSIIICTLSYAYGTCIILNCAFDQSQPKSFKVSVLDKRIIEGDRNTYYIKLSPWGTKKEVNEITVSKNEYQNFAVNSKITINVRKGKLDIPWFQAINKK